MLNESEVKRLERILEDINMELSGKDSYSLTLGDIHWLALSLQEVNTKLKYLTEGKTTNPGHKLIIKQAKDILVHKYSMTEHNAHKFLRDTAMSSRTTKFQVAKKLIDSETS